MNASHGDAALAALDPRFTLAAVIQLNDGRYTVSNRDLDRFMVPKTAQLITVDSVKASGRGIAYTKTPFVYLFERVG